MEEKNILFMKKLSILQKSGSGSNIPLGSSYCKDDPVLVKAPS